MMKYLPIFILVLMAYCSEQEEPVTQKQAFAQQLAQQEQPCTDTLLVYDTIHYYDTIVITDCQPPTGGGPQPIPCVVWDSVTFYVMDTVCTDRPDTLNTD